MSGMVCRWCGSRITNAWEENICIKNPDSSYWKELQKPSPFLQFVKPIIDRKKDLANDLLMNHGNRLEVLHAIAAERLKQINKWGLQQQHHDDGLWMKILVEEVGEVATASMEEYHTALRAELVQVAAVAVAWIEDLDWRVKRG